MRLEGCRVLGLVLWRGIACVLQGTSALQVTMRLRDRLYISTEIREGAKVTGCQHRPAPHPFPVCAHLP
jgi:hypothetical protein